MEFQYQSDKIDKILPEYIKAQALMSSGLEKNAEGNFGSYADLEGTLLFVYEHLKSLPITLRLYEVPTEYGIFLCARLIENNSHQFFATYHFMHTYNSTDPQKMGGSNTYATRYALNTLFGIPVVDINDPDYSKDTAKNQPKKFTWYQNPGCITETQDAELLAICGNYNNKKELMNRLNEKHPTIKYASQIPVTMFNDCIIVAKNIAGGK
jgi:hypothetical protein